jgi:hypothetical protein
MATTRQSGSTAASAPAPDPEAPARARTRTFSPRSKLDILHRYESLNTQGPTRYVEVRRRFLREHPGHALDGWPLPVD